MDHTEDYPPIYVVSGNLGTLGEQLARTVLAQFEDVHIPLKIVARAIHEGTLQKVVDEAAGNGGSIIHTLVDPELRPAMIRLAEEKGVFAFDAVGPVVERLAEVAGKMPMGKPGLYRQLHETYFKRIEAIDFTMHHDDGMDHKGWEQAEVVLLGVSRVGKTPVSLYLSMLGWKVANIPLVRGIEPRPGVFELDPRRVVGLTIDPGQLIFYRKAREMDMGSPRLTTYTDPELVLEEIQFGEQIFRRGGFKSINVTGKTIETSADEIINVVSRQLKMPPSP